jgi:D-3-phosphoglycerate dehydrogenase
MRFLISDYDFPDVDLETAQLRAAGHEVKVARCRTEDELVREAAGCDGILTQYVPIGRKLFDARPEVRIVSRFGAGFDTVDTEEAARHGVWVANSPDYGVGEVATHALGMALALVRHIPFYDRDVRAGRWHYLSAGELRRPAGLTLGILGLGRIGKRLAALAQPAFGRIVACDPYIADGDFPAYVERVALDRLWREADLVSLHVPLTAQTRRIAGAQSFAAMKPGSFLVNTARGAVVELDALLAALDSGRLEAAALDVLPNEPPVADHAVLRHPRVLLTPHAAFYSREGERELRRKAAQNLVDWAQKGRPTYVVVEGQRSPFPSTPRDI